MLRALLLAFGQIGDPAVLRVLAKSLGVTLALFVLLGAGLWWIIEALLTPWFGNGAGALAAVAATLVIVLALWLLFRAIAVAVIGLFADEVVVAVERRHYPNALGRARDVPFLRAAAMAMRSALRVIAINLVLAPVYVALLVTGIGTGAAFLLVNAWLLGRDLGDMVAARHLDPAAMRRWRGETSGRRFLLGLADAVLFLIPGVNLFAPLIGAAAATHLFHARRL
ncbi:membrane protein [Sphingomonas metalli]|uniref:Membrane protein n=1 Tax=Sphingomonas metalli TaxID=1779358 RepID=A0A916WNB2_9SPHN|nr:EI24 domain-containing protein [Sphingomonas metalli]GGB17106.1 membrane protein [Sphingomonas metalli]